MFSARAALADWRALCEEDVKTIGAQRVVHHPSPRSKVQQPPCAPFVSPGDPGFRANLASFTVLPIRKHVNISMVIPEGLPLGLQNCPS